MERLHLELQKHLGEDLVDGVKTKVHYGEAFKKADVLRVVNEEFSAQLKRERQELEKMTYQELIDKVQAYVRVNSKCKASMDVGMLNMNIDDVKDAVEMQQKMTTTTKASNKKTGMTDGLDT